MMNYREIMLRDAIHFKNGKKRPASEGNIPVYGGNGVLGYAGESNYEHCIIIGRVGAYCGSVYLEEGKCWVSDNAIAAVPTGGNDIKFFYYLLKGLRLNERHIGTSQPLLTQEILNKINCEVPSYPEQQRIAELLGSLDRKINVNQKLNDNLEQQAASIFAEWLNTCADFSTIGDMAHNILDYSPIASEKIRLLNSSDITEGVFPVAPLVPNKDLKGHFKKRFQFGDILYSEIRPRNHHYGVVLFDASDYIASTRLMVIRAIENKVSPAMLYQYLLLPEVEAEFTLKTESRSGTFPQGNYADMASIQVPYSPTDSQTAVSETLSQIRYTIAQNQLESQRLAELRDTLLPKLMSGEIDVSDIQL